MGDAHDTFNPAEITQSDDIYRGSGCCDCSKSSHHQWADGYGSRWYLHRDGRPPSDDDNDYCWNGVQWARLDDEGDEIPW